MQDNLENQELEPLGMDSGEDNAAPPLDTSDYVKAAMAKVEQKAQMAEQEAADQKANPPFQSWNKKDQIELAKLPAHVQAMIKEREALFNQTEEDYKAKLEQHNKGDGQFNQAINKAISPHIERIKELGLSPDIAVANLMQTELTLRQGSQKDKMAVFQQLAHDYNIDLKQAVEQPFDPHLNNLQQQNYLLNNQVQATQATQQDAENRQIQSVFQQFAQTHEHYDAVKDTIAALLEQGLANNLDEAYNKAIRLDDSLHGNLQAQQLEAAKRTQNRQADQAAKAARAANVSVRGAPTGVTHAKPAETVEQAVRNAMIHHGLLP